MVSVGSVASIFRIIFVIALLCEGSPGSCPKCEQCGKFAKLLPSITAALEQYVRLLYKASRSYNCAIETKKDCFKLASKTSRWTENALKICNISAGSTVDYLLWFDSVSGFPHRLQIQTKISSLSNRHLSSAGITLKSARTLGSRIAHAKSMNPRSLWSGRRLRKLPKPLKRQHSARFDDETAISETMTQKSRDSEPGALRRKSFNSDDEGVEVSNADVTGDETKRKIRNVPGSAASRTRSRKLSRLPKNQSSAPSDGGMKMNNDETGMSETMSQNSMDSTSGASRRKSFNSDDEAVEVSNADVTGDETKRKIRNVPGSLASRRRSRKMPRLVRNQSSAPSDGGMKMNNDETAMRETMSQKSRDSRSGASRQKTSNSDDEEVEASNADVTGDETKQKIRNIPGSVTSKRRSRILSRLLMNQFSAPSDDGIKMNNDENEMSETMPRKSRESRSRASRRKSFNSDDEGVETGNADVAGDEIRQKVRNVPGSVTSRRRSRILSRLLMNQFSAPSDDGMKMNNDETAMSETMPRKSRDSRSRASRRKSFNSDDEGVEASSADVTGDGNGRQRPIFSGSVPFRRRLRKLSRLPMHRSLKPFDGGRKMNNDESAASETMPQTLRDSESGGSRRKSFSSNDEEDPMDNADDTEGEIRQRVRYVPDLARLERRLRKLPLALKHKYFVPSDDGTKMNNDETAMGESTPQTVTDSDSESSETQTAMPQSTSAPVNDEVSMEDAGVTMNEITPPPVKDFKKNESCQGTLWIPSPIQEPVVSIPTPWISSVEPTIQINDTLVVHGHLAFNKKKFGVTVWSGTVNPTLEDIVFVILFQVDHYKVMHKTFGSGLWKRIETGELDEPLNGNFVFKLSYQNVDNQPTWVISVGSSKQSQTIRTKPIAPLDDGRKMYSVHGDIRITSLYWTGRKVTHPHVGFPEGKLPIGQRLVVHGIPRSETFTFDFDSTLNANDIPLHFRKSSENVGRNNRRKDVWGKGEIGGGQPFRTGVPTTIVFYKAAKEMLIFVDNVLKYRYKHRLLPGEDYRGVTQWEHFDTGGIHIMIC
ncbi:hypothetical protein AB6A40_006298 [Gnathostoma spinigerum]|uniref:Galectin domain-containing protein n=1 Tax=Gnathostoma spinigerum TaxID=75299 RepID=A0ABD6EHZ7_9BILA